MGGSIFAEILELQERHLRLVERLQTREIDGERFRTEVTRLRRETERLRQRFDNSKEQAAEKPECADA